MNFNILFLFIIVCLALSVVSAGDVGEAIMEDDGFIDNSYDELGDYCIVEETETIPISENDDDIWYDVPQDDVHYGNVDSCIEYYRNYVFKEDNECFCGNFSSAEISAEKYFSRQATDSIIEPVTFNTFHDLDLEIHIFMSSYEEFRFYESVDFDVLVFDVDFVFFDHVISKDLTENVIICAKKIKGDYVYSIDNLISESFSLNISSNSFNIYFLFSHKDLANEVIICAKKIDGDYVYSIDDQISESFSLNILSNFNSFLNSHFSYSMGSFYLILNGEYK